MVDKECNLRAGVYKVQTLGTTQFQVEHDYLGRHGHSAGFAVLWKDCLL